MFGPVEALNELGLRRVTFNVDSVDEVVARRRADGAKVIGEMEDGKSYGLAYIRGPDGLIVGLAARP